MIGIDGNAATLALFNHIQEITSQRDSYAEEIAKLKRRIGNLQEEYDEAKDRVENIKECKVDQYIAETQEKLDADFELEAKLAEEVREFDKVIGNYKDQLAKLFADMQTRSAELNKHCKSKEEDKRHIDTVEFGLNSMERQVQMGKDLAAKRQQRLKVSGRWEKTQKAIQDGRNKIEKLITQKANEEQEAQDIQIKFATIDGEMTELNQSLEAYLAAKAEMDALLEEGASAYEHILESSATLLQCVQREGVILKEHSFPPEVQEPTRSTSPKHLSRKPRR